MSITMSCTGTEAEANGEYKPTQTNFVYYLVEIFPESSRLVLISSTTKTFYRPLKTQFDLNFSHTTAHLSA